MMHWKYVALIVLGSAMTSVALDLPRLYMVSAAVLVLVVLYGDYREGR